MKKLLIVIGIVSIFLVGGYLVLSFYAVKFLQSQLQKVIGPGLMIREVLVRPTYLSVKGIRYEDSHLKQKLAEIEEVRVYPDLFSFLKGSLKIRETLILKPSFYLYRSREGTFAGPWAGLGQKETGEKAPVGKGKREEKSFQVQVDLFRIEKGEIDFEDRKTEGPPAKFILKDLDVEMRDIHYPVVSVQSPIEFKGKMKGKARDGSLEMKGWINLSTTDMETTLKIQEIELKNFEPYYRKRVSAVIETGHMNLKSKIAIKKKVIDAPGELELADLHIQEGGTVFWIPSKALVSLLKNKGNRINIQFHLKGNTSDPQFSLQESFLTRVAVSFAEALGIPIKGVGEKTLGGTVKGIEGVIEGLKAIEGLFEKKKEEKK